MARYIKANPLVAQHLRLENDRNRLTDGNYLLWQADMLAFGRLTDLSVILEQIGAIALAAHEARQEQDGTVVRPLPVATDPRFVIEPVEEETVEPEATEEPEEENTEVAEDPEVEPAETETEAEEETVTETEAAEDPEEETEVTEEV